jgi:hypothetical protein
MDPPREGVGDNRTNQGLLYHRLLTYREVMENVAICPYPSGYRLPIQEPSLEFRFIPIAQYREKCGDP